MSVEELERAKRAWQLVALGIGVSAVVLLGAQFAWWNREAPEVLKKIKG